MDTALRPRERPPEQRARRIILFGDSHIHAVQEALQQRSPEQERAPIEAFRLLKSKTAGGHARRSKPRELPWPRIARRAWHGLKRRSLGRLVGPEYIGDTSFEQFLTIAGQLSPEDDLVSAIGGSQHAVFSTIQHPVPFDFYLPSDADDDVAQSAALIPFRTLYEYFSEALRGGDGAMIAALKNSTRATVIHLLAPPPKRENEFITQHHDTHFAAEGITSLGVSEPKLRLKFWKLQNMALEEICSNIGVETIPPPPRAFDPDGFLKRKFYAGDATHANRRYGAILIEELERRFA